MAPALPIAEEGLDDIGLTLLGESNHGKPSLRFNKKEEEDNDIYNLGDNSKFTKKSENKSVPFG